MYTHPRTHTHTHTRTHTHTHTHMHTHTHTHTHTCTHAHTEKDSCHVCCYAEFNCYHQSAGATVQGWSLPSRQCKWQKAKHIWQSDWFQCSILSLEFIYTLTVCICAEIKLASSSLRFLPVFFNKSLGERKEKMRECWPIVLYSVTCVYTTPSHSFHPLLISWGSKWIIDWPMLCWSIYLAYYSSMVT